MIPIRYNIRSALVRRSTSFATALGVALVVFLVSAAAMLVTGVEKTLTRGGSADVVIILAAGAEEELSSSIPDSSVRLVQAMPQLAAAGIRPSMVAEFVGVIAVQKTTKGVGNVLVRGVTEESMTFRPNFRIVDGRAPKSGTEEALIGRSLRGRFRNMNVGDRVELRTSRSVQIVGVFEDGGSFHESEIWADRDHVRGVFGRNAVVSAIRARLQGSGSFGDFKAGVEKDKRLALRAHREPDFYQAQSEGLTPMLSALAIIVAFFFSIGAMLGAAVTMYGAVSNRKREIGTLRALGFSRGAILASFLIEATFLATLGGIFGVIASFSMRFVHFSMLTSSWNEVVFTFEPSGQTIGIGLALGVGMGVLGGFLPALSASRTSPLAALRAR